MFSTRFLYTIILICCLFPFNELHAQVNIDTPESTIDIYHQVHYFITDQFSTDSSVFAIQQKFREGKFTHALQDGDNLYLGTHQYACWICIPISNKSGTDQLLELAVRNPDITTLSFYLINDSNKIINEFITGKSLVFEHRPIQDRFFIFPFKLIAGRSYSLYLKVYMPGYPFYAPLSLGKQGAQVTADKPVDLFYKLFSGMMLFVTIISILLFVVNRKRVYLLYGAYILFATLYFLAEEGLDYQWIYPSWSEVVSYLSVAYGCLSLFFVIQFATEFLDIKRSRPNLYSNVRNWEWFFVVSLLVCLVLYFFFSKHFSGQQNSAQFLQAASVFQYWSKLYILSGWLMQVSMVLYMVLKKNINAYFYFVAITGLLFTTTYNILCGLGIIHKMYLPVNPMMIGFTFEIIVLSFALIYRSNQTEKEKNQLTLQLKNEQLQAAVKQLEIQEHERTRIAKDLHDEIGSNLASLKLQVEGLHTEVTLTDEFKKYVVKTISESSERLSDITHNLMPPAFHSTPLPNILQNYFDKLKQNDRIYFEFHMIHYQTVFTKDIELIIYRITLELSQNIIKHSNASSASIQLIYSDQFLNIVAEDNGTGFEIRQRGIGLESIQARVDYLGGKITIDSSLKGTLINIEIPFHHVANH